MKPNKWVSLTIAVVVIACAVKVYAGNLSMTTYYPAPTGYYDVVKINQRLIVPCYKTASSKPTELGAVWVDNNDPACR